MPFKYNLYARRALAALLNAAFLAGAVSVADARQTSSSNPTAKVQPPAPAPTPEEGDMYRLFSEGNTAFGKADIVLTEQAFKAGLDKAQALHNQTYTLQFLECLFNFHYSLGQFEQALDYGSQALGIWEQRGNQTDIAASLNNLSAVYLNLGRFEKALDYGNRALAIMKGLGEPQKLAFPLLNLGNVYSTSGQFDKALEYWKRALPLFEEYKDSEHTAITLNNLGSVYNRLEQTEKSRECYNRAYSYFEAMQNWPGIASTLDNLGIVDYSEGKFDAALDHYDRALTIRKKLPNQQDIAGILNNMGAAHYGLRQYERALDYYRQALVIKEKLGDPQNTVVTLNDMGDAYDRLDRLGEAQAVFDRAVQNFEKVSLEVGDPAQVGALQNTLPLYPGYASLRLRHQQPAEALALLERGRAQGLTRQFAQSRVDYAALFSPQDAARWRDANAERTLAENLLGAAENRMRLRTDEAGKIGAAQEQVQQAKQRDETAERQLTLLRTELRQRYPQFRKMNGAEPPTPARLNDMARRHPDTLFVQWAVTSDWTLLLALGQKDGVRGFRIPQTTKTLRGKAQAWRDAIEAAGKLRSSLSGTASVFYTEAAKCEPQRAGDLYHVLFDPLAKAGLLTPGRYRRLVLVSDGPLLDLPLAALVTHTASRTIGRTPTGPPERLLDRYAVSSAVSFGVLDWPASNEKFDLPLFCVADTGDGTMPERFGADLPVPALPADRKGSGSALPLGLRAGHTPLEYARREGKQIVGMFPGAVGLAGPLAREAVVRETMRRADILHFAVHNISDTGNAMRSWLLLAQEDADSPYDGRLEAREVASMKLRARMTVLSACESGRGQERGGDGLIGMAWAFRGAGCPCVVAAQWKVSDAASCSLMTWFYRSLLAGRSKDEAMQQAMQAVRREEGHESPFFWAGFEVIGDTAPLFRAAHARIARR